MRILGYINYGYRPPAPFVAAIVTLPDWDKRARLPLLLDTGSSNTIILWGDVERLGIDASRIKLGREFTGLGGQIGAKPISATISLTSEEGEVVEENIEIHIVTSTYSHPRLKFLPSIMGRDIINRYALGYDFANGKLCLEK